MQQHESENNSEAAKPDLSTHEAEGLHKQKQQQNQPSLIRRLQNLKQAFDFARLMTKAIFRASEQNSTARQLEDMLVKRFEELSIPTQYVQMFKDRLEKMRQRTDHARLEDLYLMGGILIYCTILIPTLISLGIPDLPAQFAWIAFVISLPCPLGVFLTRFLKKQNNILTAGKIEGILAFFAEMGILIATTSLFFHVWNVVGWLFLLCAIVIFFGYQNYRASIYYKPLLSTFVDILKHLSNTPPAQQQVQESPSDDSGGAASATNGSSQVNL